MGVFSSVVFLCFLVSYFVSAKDSDVKGPPLVSTDKEEHHKIVLLGKDTKFTCPVYGHPTPIFEWEKAGISLPEESWGHYRIQGSTLRIKEVTLEDQGYYSCSGINGFGTAKFTFRLEVRVPLGSVHTSSDGANSEPVFEQVYPRSGSVLSKYVGEDIKFQCQVSGFPPPAISWYKDGQQLSSLLEGEHIETGFSLEFHHLSPIHTGNYTCVAINKYGGVTANWTLWVTDKDERKNTNNNGQQLTPLNTSRVTVSAGEESVLICNGYWDSIKPKVMWLRRVPANSPSRRFSLNETFRYNGSHYQVLPSTRQAFSQDGKFLTELRIDTTEKDDAGRYICVVNGLSFWQTDLLVLGNEKEDSSLLLVLSLSLTIVLLVIVVIVVTVRKRSSKPRRVSGPSERALLPPSGAITQAKLLQSGDPSIHQPRYVIHPPPAPSSHGTSGHSVAPEGSVVQFPSSVVHVTPPQGSTKGQGQPVIIYQDGTNSSSLYVPSRPSNTTVSHPDYQYQHLDVI